MSHPSSVFLSDKRTTYPVRLHGRFANGLHNAAFLVLDVANPIRLSCSDEYMCVPLAYISIYRVVLVDLEFGRIVYRAAGAIVKTVVAVNCGVCCWEELAFRSSDKLARRRTLSRWTSGRRRCEAINE